MTETYCSIANTVIDGGEVIKWNTPPGSFSRCLGISPKHQKIYIFEDGEITQEVRCKLTPRPTNPQKAKLAKHIYNYLPISRNPLFMPITSIIYVAFCQLSAEGTTIKVVISIMALLQLKSLLTGGEPIIVETATTEH